MTNTAQKIFRTKQALIQWFSNACTVQRPFDNIRIILLLVRVVGKNTRLPWYETINYWNFTSTDQEINRSSTKIIATALRPILLSLGRRRSSPAWPHAPGPAVACKGACGWLDLSSPAPAGWERAHDRLWWTQWRSSPAIFSFITTMSSFSPSRAYDGHLQPNIKKNKSILF